ncbi:MAG: heme A synthase [Candidatus Dadabacteria bacterium]|nr:MAG: heme A synthase [Candidatus Dadabacteria bacterium]
MSQQNHRPVVRWLWVIYGMIVGMIALGGITRLTGSGLSMVEWAPLFGVVPPLNEADWLATFAKYKQFPQYKLVNQWMTLDDFKRIFFWEYLHRVWGRLIGLVVLLPMLWFWRTGRLEGTPKGRIVAMFFLGGLQGVVGWIMVRSGLVDQPAVSHIRLAIHLLLALFIAQWVLWLILDLQSPPRADVPSRTRRMIIGLLVLVVVQIAWGAFVAGTRAGYLFSTFPTMNGYWWPPAPPEQTALHALFHDPAWLHATHRWLGLLVFGHAIGTAMRLRTAAPGAARLLFATISVQVVLGIATVLSHVQIGLAVSHQLGGALLLSVVTWLLWLTKSEAASR